ncbi:hypothetical protein PFICI_13379 [Pestalotiopsis fici W106-1]|uniref:Uncharacterized protein n=1 Tax=Pestalotiopsis fici (strain W106-1 / CGMCC3.15140) TaxID=1229662 RepID=W3WLU5_PESFW|nr:uncharacterized protein PFICI_13379 [Pestalotiopsis fici W106-1]ETS74895.1 hypothetical protein PFICI_13379 [Pestalotiopsis fici W106-1]
MPSQIAAPVPITPTRKGMRLVTSEALFASLNETLASSNGTNDKNNNTKSQPPVRGIKERDWDVPAPPPPSPVSFQHHDQWRSSMHH